MIIVALLIAQATAQVAAVDTMPQFVFEPPIQVIGQIPQLTQVVDHNGIVHIDSCQLVWLKTNWVVQDRSKKGSVYPMKNIVAYDSTTKASLLLNQLLPDSIASWRIRRIKIIKGGDR